MTKKGKEGGGKSQNMTLDRGDEGLIEKDRCLEGDLISGLRKERKTNPISAKDRIRHRGKKKGKERRRKTEPREPVGTTTEKGSVSENGDSAAICTGDCHFHRG